MLDAILSHFSPHTHALTLVSDPDRVLGDEAVLVALAARGFRVIPDAGDDPVRLRYDVARARPWSAASPLIVVTGGPLSHLPYDLWQVGHHVALALHTFFPRLSYPEVRALTPDQRARLAQAPAPPRALGRRATRRYLLHRVFDADPEALRTPATLLAWLDAYHRRSNPMPEALRASLLTALAAAPAFAGWPLSRLLTDRAAFIAFVQAQWEGYLKAPEDAAPGDGVAESRGAYLDFDADDGLQGLVGTLVQSGTLAPVVAADARPVAAWARPAMLVGEAERLPQRLAAALAASEDAFAALPQDARWTDWQPVAWAWAALTVAYYDPDLSPSPDHTRRYRQVQQQLDDRFAPWLRERYAPLAAQRLPSPHHLYHVLHYLAHRASPADGRRAALIILDGMALADWLVIREAWAARHPAWGWEERLVLAQAPTVTAVSRQALVSGRPPADFAATLTSTRHDALRWRDFWRGHGLEDDRAAPYVALRGRDPHLPAALTSAQSRALCAVDVTLDDLAHQAALGTRDFYGSLRLWLDEGANRYLEDAIETLVARGFTVALTSDHGHTEATGMGRPSEGILAESRGARARLYSDHRTAAMVHAQFEATHLWAGDGLLPDDVAAVMAQGRRAFALPEATVVSHGGVTLDEVVVPFVIIDP